MCNLSNEPFYSTPVAVPPIPLFAQGFAPVEPRRLSTT